MATTRALVFYGRMEEAIQKATISRGSGPRSFISRSAIPFGSAILPSQRQSASSDHTAECILDGARRPARGLELLLSSCVALTPARPAPLISSFLRRDLQGDTIEVRTSSPLQLLHLLRVPSTSLPPRHMEDERIPAVILRELQASSTTNERAGQRVHLTHAFSSPRRGIGV